MIASGHGHAEVMAMTPRQIDGWLFVARRRRKRELKEFLSLSRLAAHGKREAVKEAIDELDK